MTYSAALMPHPGTSCEAVRGIGARVSWTGDGGLAFTYLLKGNLAGVRIPPLRQSLRADRLWQHTCFEAFVAVKGGAAYREFNFAPSGEWAVYEFVNYRERAAAAAETLAPKLTVRSTRDSLELDAVINLDRLPAARPGARLKLALCAVIEEESGMLSYWALNHPPGQPDFHHPDAFALEMGPLDAVVVNESAMVKR
ncbi:MAG: hypothetical protein A3F90_13040 [Deltaproteobacteria bacterium RIFCSPLOWO2_12_FULL_60_19]|nr:MAG: hypothetical protein A3F90_13040 [Deltaproteobacteria bacterium RIFCSPLOWO2_12_FULL_60_19]